MISKSILQEKAFSKEVLEKAKNIVEQIKNDMKSYSYRKAAKHFYKQHTGKESNH